MSDSLACPVCGKAMSRVVDSRGSAHSVRRRRECASCGERFTTYEMIDHHGRGPKPQPTRVERNALIVDLHLTEGKTPKELSARFHLSPSTVQHILRRNGVTPLNTDEAYALRRVRERHAKREQQGVAA